MRRCFIQFLHHYRISNMINLYQNVSRFSGLLVLNFFINKTDKFLLHLIRRYQQFFEANGRIRAFYKIKDQTHVTRHILSSRHQHIISVHTGVTFMKVSCTDTSYIRTCFHGYIGNLRVYLQSLHPKYHTDTGILHFL